MTEQTDGCHISSRIRTVYATDVVHDCSACLSIFSSIFGAFVSSYVDIRNHDAMLEVYLDEYIFIIFKGILNE